MSADLSQKRLLMGTPVEFQAHVELLRHFLTHRQEIVENIESVLNAQRKPVPFQQDRSLLSRLLENCFFVHASPIASQAGLRGQLEEAYWAGGFRPRQIQGMHNDLIHPAEMAMRAFHFWQQTRWPGRNGRLHFAHTLFNVYVLRSLEFLSLHLWDTDLGSPSPGDTDLDSPSPGDPDLDSPSSGEEDLGNPSPDKHPAGERLAELQHLLDGLWEASPPDQPAIVRDARWLIPLAQSLPTDDLQVYLETARLVAEGLPEADALEVQKAHVRMLGGHLTSQIRHHCLRDSVPIDDHDAMLRTRTSNALDFALLLQGLTQVLKAYGQAVLHGDEQVRLEMAGAILQGVSVDPELFLNRTDLLSAYSMIEHVFISTGPNGEHIDYSPLGRRHMLLVSEYRALIEQLADSLRDDLPHFRPVEGGFSPYGVVCGYPSTLTELMAFKALERDAETRYSLEEAFDEGDTSAEKLAWVDGLRKMPHIDPEIQRLYDYPHQFAIAIYERIDREIKRRDSDSEHSGTGRLYVVAAEDSGSNSDVPRTPDSPARYFATSDRQIAAAGKADFCGRAQLQHERQEAHFLVSYEVPGGWMALKKDLLTEVLGAGLDTTITGLPRDAAQALRLMCAGLVEYARGDQESPLPNENT